MSVTHRIMELFLASALAASGIAGAAADPANGRKLYHGAVAFAAGTTRLPGTFSACARCHGENGEGRREGSLQIPALTWAALTGPRDGLQGFMDGAAVLRAIRTGEGRGGTFLNAAMPRFNLAESEATALVSYLKDVGLPDDMPAGVEKQRIVLGTLLPLSGPASLIGTAVLAGLNDSLDRVNHEGGVFGRQLVLRTIDTAGGADQAARRLLEEPVFAVAGGLWPERGTVDRILAEHRVSVLAPLVPADAPASRDAWAVELLPPRTAQQAALAKAVRNCPAAGERWALRIGSNDRLDESDVIRWFNDIDHLRKAFREASPSGCLGLDLAAASTLGAAVPPTWQKCLVLPIPASLLRPDGSDATPWRRLGRIAGQLAVELLSRSGTQLQERSPIEAAARLADFAPLRLGTTRSEGGMFRGWDAEVIAVSPSEPVGVNPPEPLESQGG